MMGRERFKEIHDPPCEQTHDRLIRAVFDQMYPQMLIWERYIYVL
jgi:hypothetical protein